MTVRAAAPWYVHPAADPEAWRRLVVGGRLAFAVVNVASGPGRSATDPYYSRSVLAQSRTPLLGYVSVRYGNRSGDEVRRQAQEWRDWYGITGVMLDETPSVVSTGAWSLRLVDRLRADGASKVVLNPGTIPAPELVAAADVTCVFEGSWQSYRELRLPRWIRRVDPDRQWHLVHSCPRRRLRTVRRWAERRGAGHVWATPGAPPNPWEVLPEEW